MKQRIYSFAILLTILLGFSLSSCSGGSPADDIVTELNKEMPMFIDEGLTGTQAFAEGPNVVMEITVDEDVYDFSELKLYKSELKDMMRAGMLEDGDNEDFEVLADNNVGIIYRFTGDQSGRSFDVSYSPNELRRMSRY